MTVRSESHGGESLVALAWLHAPQCRLTPPARPLPSLDVPVTPRCAPAFLVLVAAACSTPTTRDRDWVDSQLAARVEGAALACDEEPLPPGVDLADGLTVEEAVATALWRNASFLEALQQLELSRADLVAAGQLSDPTFSYLFPIGPKQFEWTLGAPLTDLWLRPRRVAAALREVERTSELIVQGGLDLVRDVKLAHADWRLAVEREELALEEVSLRERVLALEIARRDAGETSPALAIDAELVLGRARIAVTVAQGAAAAGAARLGALLGLDELPAFQAKGMAEPIDASLPPLEQLRRQALASRPDLRACELALEAAAERQGLTQIEAWQVTFMLDANQRGTDGFEAGPGLLLGIPLFSGNEGRKVRASAELEQAAIRYRVRHDAILGEVNGACVALEANLAARDGWEAGLVEPSERRVRVAEAAFVAGDASGLDIALAHLTRNEARVRLIEAEAAVRRSRAELERSLGGHLWTAENGS